MKCAVAFAVLLAACSASFADSPDRSSHSRSASTAVLEELVRMTRAGSPDGEVLAYARAHRGELPAELPDPTLQWLRASGVSERVVRYMRAIDVRESALNLPEGVTYADEGADTDDVTEPRGGREARRSYGDGEGDAEAYAGYDSDSGDYGYDSRYDSGFGYDPYLYFGYPYVSAPYFSYFFVNRGDFFRRFPGHRGHRGRRDSRFDGGRAGWRDRGRPRDGWRERGFSARSRGSIAAGPRTARHSFTGGYSGGRGGARSVHPRGFGSPRSSRGGFASGFPGARGTVGSPRGSAGGAHRGGGASRHAPAGGRGRR